jgi:tetratricopeptide (TPR) repeat protein
MLRYGPLWLVCLGYAFLRIRLMGSFAHPTKVNLINAPETLLSAVALAGQYVGKLFWPAHLSAFYLFHASASFFEVPVLWGLCALGLGGYLFYTLWKWDQPVSFGILWMFVTLAPVLNARWMSAYVFGERYLYLPSVGFCLAAGWACAILWQPSLSLTSSARTAMVAAACVLTTLCVLRISWRVLDWRDDVTLFTQALAAEPGDYHLHDALATAYWIRGESEGAEREWQETLRLQPHSVGPLASLGALYAQQGRFGQAIPLLENALRLNADDADAHLNLGAAYAETGNPDRAEEQFRAALLLAPMNFSAHNVLGKLYFDSRRLAEAEQQFLQSLQCEPNLAAYDHLGYIYLKRGEPIRAEEAFRSALAMKSTDSHAHYNLGLIYSAAGRNTQAAEELQAALAADPNNPDILSALEKLRH